MARSKDIRVPCEDEEWTEIHRRAAAAGLPTSLWLRRLALGIEQAPPAGDVKPAPDGRRRRPKKDE